MLVFVTRLLCKYLVLVAKSVGKYTDETLRGGIGFEKVKIPACNISSGRNHRSKSENMFKDLLDL